MAECWAGQKYIGEPVAGKTATDVLHNRMRAAKRCDPSGVTTAGKIHAQALADGFAAARHTGAGWLDFMLEDVKGGPVVFVLLFQNAHVLRDSLTGAGMDAGSGLRGHFVMAAEYHAGGHSPRAGRDLPAGFFCADGDSDVNNPIVGGKRTRRRGDHRLVFYTVDMLRAADVVDVVAVYPRVSFPKPSSGGTTPPPAPVPALVHIENADGVWTWDEAAKTLSAPNGVVLVGGNAALVHRQLEAKAWVLGVPRLAEWKYRDAAGLTAVQAFRDGATIWRPGFAEPRVATPAELAAALAYAQTYAPRVA